MRTAIWTSCLILIEANAVGVHAKDALQGLAASEISPLYCARYYVRRHWSLFVKYSSRSYP